MQIPKWGVYFGTPCMYIPIVNLQICVLSVTSCNLPANSSDCLLNILYGNIDENVSTLTRKFQASSKQNKTFSLKKGNLNFTIISKIQNLGQIRSVHFFSLHLYQNLDNNPVENKNSLILFDTCEIQYTEYIMYVNPMSKIKIARRTTGAKGCYFLAGFLQVLNMYLKHCLKLSNIYLRSV